MPYEITWVDPEIFLEHNGVTIYCTYKYDEVSNGPYDNWFTMYLGYSESSGTYDKDQNRCGAFDIRELPGYKEILKSKPPYIDTANDSDEVVRKKNMLWAQWRQVEPAMIRDFLRGAIDRGDLVPPEPHDA